jgi:hypothetical protein
MIKKLNIEDGVVMGHPYEIAELSQRYANENLQALADALFEERGVTAPHTDELEPQASEANVDSGVELAVRPGFAIVGNGVVRVQSTTSLVVDRERFQNGGEVRVRKNGAWSEPLFSTSEDAYLSLMYEAARDTPVDIVPYGNGEVELRVVPGYRLTLTESAPAIEEGVPVGRVTPSGLGNPSVEDVRASHAARLRADQTLREKMVDPALVGDVEEVFGRDGIVEDIHALFDDQMLNGERVVTRLKEAAEPVFVRTRNEPAVRKTLRDMNTIDAELEIRPDPARVVEVEWNLYGVLATKTGPKSVEIRTEQNFGSISYQSPDVPLQLRFDGDLYPIEGFPGPNTVSLKTEIESSASEDPNAAITNGAEEFQVVAEPSLKWFRKGKGSKDFAVESDSRAPVGQLSLEPGAWNVIIQSKSQDARATTTHSVEIPELIAPRAPASIDLSGEQVEPATEEDGDTIPANPFNNIEVDQRGEPKVNQEDLDRYIDRIREELKRIQEQEVNLRIEITPQSRTRSETKQSMTVGYKLAVEMLTGEGWQTERETVVYRSTTELMRELTWIDLMSDRYRGSVSEKQDLANLSHNMGRLDVTTDSDRPLKENDVVHVASDSNAENNGYWRYEPKMRADQASSLTDENGDPIQTFPYSDNEGYWIQVDVSRGSFQGDTMNVNLNGIKGGTDYRVTVQPVGEDGQNGEKTTLRTKELRDKFNAQLGFDLHRAINDIYSGYQEMMETIDPETFNEYLENRLNEIRKIIDQASLYGTPPKVSGPFDVPRQPGVTRFSGRNLGSVQKVFMRYTPPGESDENSTREEITEEANFKVLVGQGDPQVAIKNLPNIEQLSKEEAPVVTLEFNAGARGSDFFAVRYEQSQPSVVGPNVLSFKEERVSSITESTTYGNTASYWRYDSRVGEAQEPTPYGPFPKRWPKKESSGAKSGIFSEPWAAASDEALDGYGLEADFEMASDPSAPQHPVEETEEVRALQLRAKKMVPSDVLDIRIRRLPEERLVPQIAYKGASRFGNQVGDPYYYALQHTNNGVEVLVPSRATNLWIETSFAIEYVFYPSSLAGGELHDGKGLVLKNRGRFESAPPVGSASVGDYYYNGAENQPYVCDLNESGAKAWMKSETIEFGRHTFTVQSDPQSQSRVDRIESRFIVDAAADGNEADLAGTPPELGYNTPPDSARRKPPFSRGLVEGADLDVQAPIEATGESGDNYIFDEWRRRANTFEKNRPSLPANTQAISGERREPAAGPGGTHIQGRTQVKDSGSGSVVYIARYKKARDFSGNGDGALTVDRYVTGETDNERVVVSHGGTEYLVDQSGSVSVPAGTDLTATGIVMSREVEIGGSVYPVIRVTSIGEAAQENVEITGPSQVIVHRDESLTINYEVNKGSIDSKNIGWVGGTTLPITDKTVVPGTSTTQVSVTVDWSNLFGDTTELERLRPDDEIGRTEYEGPLYRESDVFDYESPSVRVKTLRLRVTVTVGGVSDTDHTSVQVTPRVDTPYQ